MEQETTCPRTQRPSSSCAISLTTILTSIVMILQNSFKLMLPLSTIMDCPKRHAMLLRELWRSSQNFIVFILSSIAVILRHGVTIMASLSVPVDHQKVRAMPTQRLWSSCGNFVVPALTSISQRSCDAAPKLQLDHCRLSEDAREAGAEASSSS